MVLGLKFVNYKYKTIKFRLTGTLFVKKQLIDTYNIRQYTCRGYLLSSTRALNN